MNSTTISKKIKLQKLLGGDDRHSRLESEMKTVLITGTNKGLGLEFTKQYLNEGWNVIATCRSPSTAKDLLTYKEKHQNYLTILSMDLTNEASIKQIGEKIEGRPIDIFISNAGTATGYASGANLNDFGNIQSEPWVNVFRTNCVAPLLLAQVVHPNILLGSDKKLIFITSKPASITENTGGALYMNRSSRTALNQVIKSLSIDLYEQGISVASVSPGWVKTDSGGEGALIDAETSVSGIKKVIEKLDMSQTARFCDYKGEAIAW